MGTTNFALITGASSGIGKAIAREFAGRGINVALVALPGTGTFDVAQEITDEFNVRAVTFEVDLTASDSVSGLYDWTINQRINIQYLVNNAGFGNLTSLENTDPSVIRNMMLLNNFALVMLTQVFLSDMKRMEQSYILNVGSLASFIPIPNKTVYSATKSFVYGFTSSLRLELRKETVSVSCLAPGATVTSAAAQERLGNVVKKPGFLGQSAADVARTAVTQLFRRKALIIPGWHNKLTYVLWNVLPRMVAERIVVALFDRRPRTNWSLRRLAVPRPSFALMLR
jgi:uncharacterized protein